MERTLAPIPIVRANQPQAAPDIGEDPLRKAVLTVLWNGKPIQHVPVLAELPGTRVPH